MATVRGYLVRPAGEPAKYGAVVVVHENRGLNPYIEDVARRVAKAGYLALAPDGLTSVGGYPGNDEEGRELQRQVDPTKLMNDFFAAVEFLIGHEMSTGKVGIVGFCYGGGVCNAAAVAYPELACAVPFYGRAAEGGDRPKIQARAAAALRRAGHRITGGWPDFEAALDAAGKTYEAYVYEGVNHGFHNDSTPRYDEAAAELAWEPDAGLVRQVSRLSEVKNRAAGTLRPRTAARTRAGTARVGRRRPGAAGSVGLHRLVEPVAELKRRGRREAAVVGPDGDAGLAGSAFGGEREGDALALVAGRRRDAPDPGGGRHAEAAGHIIRRRAPEIGRARKPAPGDGEGAVTAPFDDEAVVGKEPGLGGERGERQHGGIDCRSHRGLLCGQDRPPAPGVQARFGRLGQGPRGRHGRPAGGTCDANGHGQRGARPY